MPDTELPLRVTRWCEPEPTPDEVARFLASRIVQLTEGWAFWIVSQLGVALGHPRPRYNFATDRNACALFEALVEGREVWSQYVDDMLFVLGLRHEPGSVPITPFEAWALYRAPPRARCLALVAMVGGDDE